MEDRSERFSKQRLTRRRLLKTAALASLGLAGLSALSGCGSNGPAGTKPAATSAPAGAPAGAPAATSGSTGAQTSAPKPTAAVAQETPKRGGVLTSMIFSPPERPDPTLTTSARVQTWTYQIYGHLLRLDPQSFGDTRLFPELCKKWTVSPDGLDWTLELQEGVKWQNKPPLNGREFTAEDVGWNIDYYKAKSVSKQMWESVESWKALDKHTIKFHLKAPNADQLSYLGTFFNQMMPHEVYEADGNFDKKTIGTGPMMFKQYDTGTKVTLERNPDYWEKSPVDGKPLPYLDGLEVFVIPDHAAQTSAVLGGKIDRPMLQGTPFLEEIDKWKQQDPHAIITVNTGKPCIQMFLINCRVKPFDDKRVRQAVSYALDRDALGTAAYGKNNYEWKSWVPVEGWGMSDAECRKAFPYDPDKAKALLKEVGVTTPLPVVITPYSMDRTEYKAMAMAAQQLLNQAGFKADIKWVQTTEWEKRKLAGDFVIGSLPGQVSSQIDYWLGATLATGASRNFGKFGSKAFDDVATAEKAELDEAKRKALVRKAELILVDEMPIVPTLYPKYVELTHDWVHGEKAIHWMYPFPRIEKMWLSR